MFRYLLFSCYDKHKRQRRKKRLTDATIKNYSMDFLETFTARDGTWFVAKMQIKKKEMRYLSLAI